MADIELSFEDIEPARSGQVAQDMRRSLIDSGLPPGSVDIARSNPEAMDGGSLVQIAIDALNNAGTIYNAAVPMVKAVAEPVAPLFELAALAKCIYEIGFRDRCSIRIKTAKGEIRIGRGEESWEQIRDRVVDLLDDKRGA